MVEEDRGFSQLSATGTALKIIGWDCPKRDLLPSHLRVRTIKGGFMTIFSLLKAATVSAALALMFSAPADAADMSMKKRMQAYFDTVNKGDVAGAGAFYAPNAVIEDPIGIVVKSTAADFIKGAM